MLRPHQIAWPSAKPESEELRPYIIVGRIRKNSFATWYRGCHEDTRVEIAIKMVRRDTLAAKEFSHLQSEIQILQSLSHQHISRLIDVVDGQRHISMILEYYNGGDLQTYIQKRGAVEGLQYRPTPDAELQWWLHPRTGGLDITVVRSLLNQLADALKYLREHDIVHRNINPMSLLLTAPSPEELQSGHPLGVPILKVAGFFFACSLPTGTRLTKTARRTPHKNISPYTAPEILRYENCDVKADLWSVGVVLYEMAVGQPPFRGQNRTELLKNIESTDKIRFPDESGFYDENLFSHEFSSRFPFGLWGPSEEFPVPYDIKELIRHLLRDEPTERSSFDGFLGSMALVNSRNALAEVASGTAQSTSLGRLVKGTVDLSKRAGMTEVPGNSSVLVYATDARVLSVGSLSGPMDTAEEEKEEEEEEEEEMLHHEYVLVDNMRDAEFSQTVDGIMARPRQLLASWSNSPTPDDDFPFPFSPKFSPGCHTADNDNNPTLQPYSHYPTDSPVPTPSSSISRHGAAKALNRAIGLASKKLLGSSRHGRTELSEGSLLKTDNSNEGSNTGESESDVSTPATSTFKNDHGPATKIQVSALMARLDSVFSNVAQYRQLLRCTGEAAQKLLDSFQALLDMPQMNAIIGRKKLIVATQRLSQNSGLYPTCYRLDNVQRQGDYRINSGGSADIYRGAIDGQAVCLKMLRMFQTDNNLKHFLKLVSKEAILWGQLKHRNVLAIYGLYQLDNELCFVAPWMEAGDINEYLRQKPSASRRHLALDVAKGLLYLHQNEIIHGDLKGANVLVNAAGIACLADFGLSSISDPLIVHWTSQSSSASKGGTARWQAPELFDVENDIVVKNSMASDVYAWSCVCYEIFTGLIPFSHIALDASVVYQIMQGQRPSCPEKSSSSWAVWGLTENTWTLMTRCWGIDPAERPSTQDVIDEISLDLDEDTRPSEDCVGGALSPTRFRRRLNHVGDVTSIVTTLDRVLDDVLDLGFHYTAPRTASPTDEEYIHLRRRDSL